MDRLAKNLFDEFDSEVKPGLPRPKVLGISDTNRSLLCPEFGTPESTIRELSSPKSSDSLIDEMDTICDFLSPNTSPMKINRSPDNQSNEFSCSPPCLNKGLLNLRLFDTPHTPKTLFTKLKKFSAEENESYLINNPVSLKQRRSLREKFMKKELQKEDRKRPQTAPRPERNVVYANFNPFTPNSEVQLKAKRPRIHYSR